MDESKEKSLRQKLSSTRQKLEAVDTDILEAVPFLNRGRRLDVAVFSDEFSHICPMTGLPDYGELTIDYQPREKIVELKSLKYFLVQYRNVGVFYEHVIFHILDALVALLDPLTIRVNYETRPRGGLSSSVSATWPEADANHSKP